MPSRLVWTVPATALLVAVLVAVAGAAFSGAAAPLLIGDAGPVVRWGMVLGRTVHDTAAALTVGLLLVGGFLVREGRTTQRRRTAGRLATMAALLWFVSAAVVLVLGFGDLAGLSPDAPGYPGELLANLTSLEVMRLRLTELVMVAALLALCAVARTRATLAWGAVLALACLAPLAFAGHSSGNVDHETGVTALGLHLVGLTLWVGGLAAIALLRPVLGSALPDTVRRFSTVALWAYALVALSGTLFAVLTVGEAADLVSPYWLLIWLKIALLVILGAAGWWQRSRIIAGGLEAPGAFARLALTEVVLMAAAIGLGVALSRTEPPSGTLIDAADPVYQLTGAPMPDQPWAWARLLDTFRIDWLFLLIALVAVGLYLAGVVRLHRRGDRWPVLRTVLWVLGWAVFVYTTSGALAVYGRIMFSVHMVMHMTLMMIIPLLLVPAQAITLAYRTLPARRDRTLGPREVLLAVVHSGWARFVVNPIVAGINFFGSLVVFYWTGMLAWALTSHLGHVFMVVHFSLTGFAFVWSMVGQDPGPAKWPAPLRAIVVLATLAGHAFFGVAMMQGTWLLAPELFKALEIPWVDSLIVDQQTGGALAWGLGEAPTVVIVLMVVLDWMRRDERDARRSDRRAERDHDAELEAYNARLRAMNERSSR